jgi:hypothetical protein
MRAGVPSMACWKDMESQNETNGSARRRRVDGDFRRGLRANHLDLSANSHAQRGLRTDRHDGRPTARECISAERGWPAHVIEGKSGTSRLHQRSHNGGCISGGSDRQVGQSGDDVHQPAFVHGRQRRQHRFKKRKNRHCGWLVRGRPRKAIRRCRRTSTSSDMGDGLSSSRWEAVRYLDQLFRC